MSLSTDLASDEWVVFRYSTDPFVNEGAVQLGRHLMAAGVARIDRRAVVATASPERVLPRLRAELFGSSGVLTNTHRRTSRAYHVNALATGTLPTDGRDENDEPDGRDDTEADWLGEGGGESGATIPAPNGPFPGRDEDATVFPDDDLSDDGLASAGLNAEALDRAGDSAYSLHPSYLGPPRADHFASARENAERYFDVLEDVVVGTGEDTADTEDIADTAGMTDCMCCGSALPNWKWELDDWDDTHLEYSQSFTPLVTKSGRPQPLGQKRSRNTWYRGRCPACLLAGFYYTCMPLKPIASTDDAGVYRVFCVKGNFRTIETVRRAYEQTAGLVDPSTPSRRGTVRMSSLSSFPVRSSIAEIQSVGFFAALLRGLAADTDTDAPALFPDAGAGGESVASTGSLSGGISFLNTPGKGGNPVRGLSAFSDIPATAGLYDRLRERTRDTTEGPEFYDPFDDVLAWYVSIGQQGVDAEIGVAAKRNLARGILDGKLALLERGVFGLFKEVAGGATAQYGMSIGRHHHYFEQIMADIATTITDETRDSIKNAGRSIGQMFAESDDVSVLQSFHHANSPDQFLAAMEKAGMGAAKKSHDPTDRDAHSTWVANSQVDDLIGAITDDETFEAAKQMFVIHMAVSAHYQNSRATDTDGTGTDSSTDGTDN